MAHNYGKRIGGDFKSKYEKIIPRLAIREFIYNNVMNKKITNLSNQSINKVLHRFNLSNADKNKVKKMIEIILHRDNRNLQPIQFEKTNWNLDQWKNNINSPAIQYQDKRNENIPEIACHELKILILYKNESD